MKTIKSKNNPGKHCAGPHSLSCCFDGKKAVASVHRTINGKMLRAELDGKEFSTSDAAFSAMRERGYAVTRLRLLPLFAGVSSYPAVCASQAPTTSGAV